eukprot:9198282-Lingulodinium_polyedra.AAC.1
MSAWLTAGAQPWILAQAAWQPGALLEVVLAPTSSRASALALFELYGSSHRDATGLYLEAAARGAPQPWVAAELDAMFPPPAPGAMGGILHLCANPAGPCAGALLGRHVEHATAVRVRAPASL